MSDLKVVRKHTIGIKKAKVAAQKVADDLAQEYGMESTWEGDVLRFTRKGVDGALTVTKDSVVLDAKLGFLLLDLQAPDRRARERQLRPLLRLTSARQRCWSALEVLDQVDVLLLGRVCGRAL